MPSPQTIRTLALLFCAASWAPPCRAQYPGDFHSEMVEASVGRTAVHGVDSQNFKSFTVYQAGAGLSLLQAPKVGPGKPHEPAVRRWNVFGAIRFLYAESQVTGNLQDLINNNPQIPVFLGVTGGHGKFYGLNVGPRLQYSFWRYLNVYGQVDGGWLRRSLNFTKASTEGTVLQPGNPSIYSQASNSGAVGFAGGLAAGAKGIRAFLEIRALRGFGINHTTSLEPIVSGGLRW